MNTQNSNEKLVNFYISMFCLIVFAVPIPVASIVVALQSQNSLCQVTDPVGLNLSQWLLGAGIGGLISCMSLVILSIVLILTNNNEGVAFAISALVAFNGLFNFIYSIIGSVVFFRSNLDCLTQGENVGIMTLISVILYYLGCLCFCCRARVTIKE